MRIIQCYFKGHHEIECETYQQFLGATLIPGRHCPVLPAQSQTAAFTLQNKFIKHPKQKNVCKNNVLMLVPDAKYQRFAGSLLHQYLSCISKWKLFLGNCRKDTEASFVSYMGAYHEAVPKRFHDLWGFSRDLQRLLPKLAELITQKHTDYMSYYYSNRAEN